MSLTIVKAELVDNIQNGYNQFETLIAPLSNEEMTVAKVNDCWTIQDNIAHLTVWQDYLLSQLEGVIDGKQPPEFMPGLSEDEENESIYQLNKDRPLSVVLADFRLSYQRVLAAVKILSEETINAPLPWRQSEDAAWGFIAGNTYEHYEEHGNIIRRWLRHE